MSDEHDPPRTIPTSYGFIRRLAAGDVVSPWLTAEEAAVYCGRNDAEYINSAVRGGRLSQSTAKGKRMYHVARLDAFFAPSASVTQLPNRPRIRSPRRRQIQAPSRGSTPTRSTAF